MDIDLQLASDNKTLIVKPVNAYVSRESYTLYIDDAIKSKNGKNLLQAVKVTFSIR
ncbi:Ig-like domain-containing protein [Bacillus sp. FSL W8-0102]|uniref:Ig-like domain-containing protein n=1 Tax=Bacillus sp. FSL W8-0102 TaxID=2978205 RepID=UPI00403FCCE3